MKASRGRVRRPRTSGQGGITFIELAIMSLIVTIALVAITTAIQTASRGNLMAKERSRAMALGQDRLEEVKHMGYDQLSLRVSLYPYPDQPDPSYPLYQRKDKLPYPAVAPTPEQDPWTPETILQGGVTYWRHVKVKFVKEPAPGEQLEQYPEACSSCNPVTVGGEGTDSGLAMIEVDITWLSRRTGRTEQVRLTTMLANTLQTSIAIGTISGSIFDDDTNNDGVDGGSSAMLPAPLGVDDASYTAASLAVVAKNITTNEEYSVPSAIVGSGAKSNYYHLTGLPNGTYTVELRGAPYLHDSGYTGQTSPPGGLLTLAPVTLSPGDSDARGVDIWSTRLVAINVFGRFSGVPLGGHTIRVTANDGLSAPKIFTLAASVYCDGINPCSFQLQNVAWPAGGFSVVQLSIEDMTTGTRGTAALCFDAAVQGTTFYVGEDPNLHPGSNPCGGACAGTGGANCVNPDPTAGPVDISAGLYSPATITCKVWEVFDGGTPVLLSGANQALARISLLAAGSGLGATRGIDANGCALFSTTSTGVSGMVPLEPAGNVTMNAYMTTTGWAVDTLTVPFSIESGVQYNLIEGSGTLEPPADLKHTFVLIRVGEISGTVWEIDGIKGAKGAQVFIRNDITGWSTTVKCDDNGRFSHQGIPQDPNAYVVSPIVGSDYVSVPDLRNVQVKVHGSTYRNDTLGEGTEFVLTAVNGRIAGTVSKSVAGSLIRSGAVVIASTYNAASFPDTLPSPLLANKYSYSTVTLTDGTFELRVATGVGTPPSTYWIYAYVVKDGAMSSVANLGPVTVTPGVITPFNVVIP